MFVVYWVLRLIVGSACLLMIPWFGSRLVVFALRFVCWLLGIVVLSLFWMSFTLYCWWVTWIDCLP